MLNISRKVSGIVHPLVRDVYLKKDFGYRKRAQDVLVIETAIGNDNESSQKFYDLLIDLQAIEHQAEQAVGHIDRVDIVTH